MNNPGRSYCAGLEASENGQRAAGDFRAESPSQPAAAGEDDLLPLEDQRVAAFIETSERYRSRLLSVARRIAPTAEDAEDMVQDALLKAYRKLAQFRSESRMETWLYTITQNSAREFLRRKKNRNDVSLDQPWSEEETWPALSVPDPGLDPEESCLMGEMQAMLLKSLSKLGPKCKQAIVLCLLEEVPQRAAAEQLRVRPATIKARVFHGKQTLKRSIRKLHRERSSRV